MTITYSDGTVLEAIVFAHEEESLRVAVAGEGDVRILRRVGGNWLSEDNQPVKVQFAWESQHPAVVPMESDCICPPELASRLIAMLNENTGEDDLLDHSLYTFSPEGGMVRINQSSMRA
jgi:hypothetical protein